MIVVFASALFRTVALLSIVMGKDRKRHISERGKVRTGFDCVM